MGVTQLVGRRNRSSSPVIGQLSHVRRLEVVSLPKCVVGKAVFGSNQSAHMGSMITIEELKAMRSSNYRGYRYTSTIESPRAASRTVTIHYTGKFAERIARPDGRARYHLEISDGQYQRMRPADQVKLPKSLEQPLAELIEAVSGYEHKLASAFGILPIAQDRVDYYRGHILSSDLLKIRQAEELRSHFSDSMKNDPGLAATLAGLVEATVLRGYHDDKVDRLQDQIEAAERRYRDLEDETEEMRDDHKETEEQSMTWTEISSQLIDVQDRLVHRDLGGLWQR